MAWAAPNSLPLDQSPPGTMTITTAMGDKVVTLATNNDYLDQATFPSSMITTKKYADENRDILVRFTRALQMAMD